VLKTRCLVDATTRRCGGRYEKLSLPCEASAPASNAGGSSESLTACAVRKLTAGSSRHAALARTKSTIADTAGR
jgi:hypothetical protein